MENVPESGELGMLKQAFLEIVAKCEDAGEPPVFVQITIPTPTEVTYRLQIRGAEDYEGGYLTS